MALRDTLEYERTFTSMPSDWRDRPDNGSIAGEFARVDPGQSWCYNGDLVLGIKADPANPGKYLVGQVESIPLMGPFGFWEALVKFPTAPGVLAGWWLQPEPPYATAKHVEVDIAENSGNPNIWHTLWLRADAAGNVIPWGSNPQYRKVPDPALMTDLGRGVDEPQAVPRRYGCRITPTGYTWLVDGVKVGTVNDALTDVPHRMVLSLKVPDYLVGSLDPTTLANNRMKVSWVRKYAP